MYTILAIDQITKHINAQREHQTACVRNFENINNEDLDTEEISRMEHNKQYLKVTDKYMA